MNRKYTHIFFDLDNTLWDFQRNSKAAMHSTFHLLQLEKAGHDFKMFFDRYATINHALWQSYRKKEIKKKELTKQRFKLTFDELSIKDIDPQEMNELYLSEMPKQTALVKGTVEILEYLKDKKYRLFIITNGFSEVQHKKLESSDLQKFFEKVYISEEIKAPKPAREIFEHALKSGNAKKSKSIMIGDDFDVDILGAIKAGLDAIYYLPKNKIEKKQDNSNMLNNRYFLINDLKELKNIF